MGAGTAKAFPSPGAAGSGLGTNAQAQLQAPARQPNLGAMQPLQALKPMTPSMGKALQPGQAAFPVGQTPMNPWGVNRGGNGLKPIYRRPGTLPGT